MLYATFLTRVCVANHNHYPKHYNRIITKSVLVDGFFLKYGRMSVLCETQHLLSELLLYPREGDAFSPFLVSFLTNRSDRPAS